MGTNFYMMTDSCECCGHYDIIHIGKSSAGWCFALKVYPDKGVNSLNDWKGYIYKIRPEIRNDCGDCFSYEDLFDIIENRRSPVGSQRHERYYGEPGPNNLFRQKIDRVFCVGHGEGTWDYILGELS